VNAIFPFSESLYIEFCFCRATWTLGAQSGVRKYGS
jgi:hypothetical protein